MNKLKQRQWHAEIPGRIEKLGLTLNLSGIEPLCSSAWYYVVTAFQRRDSGMVPVVLKLGCDNEIIKQEMITLQLFQDSSRCVRLLDVDIDGGALLLERIIPGVSLKSLFPGRDEEAAGDIVKVMQSLHAVPVPVYSDIPTIADWLLDLQTDHVSLQHLLPKARKLAQSLVATQQKPVLLHGDLHHDNILLSSDNVWIAIDPRGVIGEPAYEVGSFIRNPMPELLQQHNVKEILARRLKVFANLLAIDQDRLKQWSYVQAVLAACWALEDGVDATVWSDVASVIDSL
jgi:streptomycin 6-kinase